MAAAELPSEFDVVILGTGLVESIVAAACSRVGHRVLHLDRRSYYAGKWASFTFSGLLSLIEEHNSPRPPAEPLRDWSKLLLEGEDLICLSTRDSAPITNLQVFDYTSEVKIVEAPDTTEGVAEATDTTEEVADHQGPEVEDKEEKAAAGGGGEEKADEPRPLSAQSQSERSRKRISYAHLLREGRRFNIDLVSKLMYSRGPLVDLLIKSNVSRYAEFKNVTRILTYHHGNIQQVPCSRADVFSSKQLSVVEKRMLMRFLTSCLEQETTQDYQDFSERPYLEFLQHHQLTDNLQHFLLHSIAMATTATSTQEALTSTRHFLSCLGRYGNTPFLFPLYGLGEIPQCFCRMCAVFGGIYCLRHSLEALVVDSATKRCTAVIDSQGQRISCSHVVLEDGCLDEAPPTRLMSRAVLITDVSLLPSDSEQQVSMVTVPIEGQSVRLVELSSSSMTSIPGTHLVHMTCQSSGSAHQDLSPLVTRLFRSQDCGHHDQRPSVLWCVYFNMADSAGFQVRDVVSNVWLCPGPDSSLGHQQAVTQAELIFQKILPDEEFCPPAPNPEDILYDTSPAPQEEGEESETNTSPQEEAGTSPARQEEEAGTSPARQEEEAGTSPARQEEEAGTSPARQEEEAGTSPARQEEAGTSPARQEEEAGTSPARQEEAGTSPAPQEEAGTSPAPQEEAGTSPARQEEEAETDPSPREEEEEQLDKES